MKKMIVVAVLGLFGTQFAKAQVAKGDFLVGGNVGFNTTTNKVDGSDDKITNSTFAISPRVGYALSNNWMVGVFAQTSFTTDKTEVAGNETKDQSTTIMPGVFVRNYHNLGSSKFAFFGEAAVGYGFGTEKESGTKTAKTSTLFAGVAPGISYFVTKCFVLEGTFGGLSYTNRTIKDEVAPIAPDQKRGEFDFTFTKEINIGVSFLF